MTREVRVLLVDDHAVVREGYRTLLEKHEGLQVVGEASDAAAAYHLYKELEPHVVVMDITMPGRGGIDAIEHIRRWDAQARVLVFTMHAHTAYALQAFRAGARGYVTKSLPARASRQRRARRCRRPPRHLSGDQRASGPQPGAGGKGAARRSVAAEFEIFRMILDARSTDDIAAALNVSRKTAANYHYAIKSKLGAASDIELLHFGLRQGLVAPVLPPADGSHGS